MSGAANRSAARIGTRCQNRWNRPLPGKTPGIRLPPSHPLSPHGHCLFLRSGRTQKRLAIGQFYYPGRPFAANRPDSRLYQVLDSINRLIKPCAAVLLRLKVEHWVTLHKLHQTGYGPHPKPQKHPEYREKNAKEQDIERLCHWRSSGNPEAGL